VFSSKCKAFLAAVLAPASLLSAATGAQTLDDFFDPAVMNQIYIELHPFDWRALRARPESNQFYPCNITWGGATIEQALIRSRGTGSRNRIKPGFRIDVDQSQPGRRFLGLKSFILDNGAQDPSLMKELLTMRLFERMNLAAPKETHVKLFVNGEYFGLYILAEEIDETFLTRRFGENSGYLYEYRWSWPYHFEYIGADPRLYSPAPFQPETHEAEIEPRLIEAMIHAIDPDRTPDSVFTTVLPAHLDIEAVLRYLAVESYVAEWDGLLGAFGINNFYLYRSRNGVSRFIPWDKDAAFGGFIPAPEDRIYYPILQNAEENVLFRRLLSVPEWRAAYFEALAECARIAGGPGGWLETEILRIYGLIAAAALEDSNKVCPDLATGNLRPCSNDEFEAETAFLITFARNRAAYVQESLEAARQP
jgi:hypothetical protein